MQCWGHVVVMWSAGLKIAFLGQAGEEWESFIL